MPIPPAWTPALPAGHNSPLSPHRIPRPQGPVDQIIVALVPTKRHSTDSRPLRAPLRPSPTRLYSYPVRQKRPLQSLRPARSASELGNLVDRAPPYSSAGPHIHLAPKNIRTPHESLWQRGSHRDRNRPRRADVRAAHASGPGAMTWPTGETARRDPQQVDEEHQLGHSIPLSLPPPAPSSVVLNLARQPSEAAPASPKLPEYTAVAFPSRADRFGRGPDRDFWWTAKIVVRSCSLVSAVVIIVVELYVLMSTPESRRDPGASSALWSVVCPVASSSPHLVYRGSDQKH